MGDEHYQGGLQDSLQKHPSVQGSQDYPPYWKVLFSTTRRGRYFVSKRIYRKCHWEPKTRILFQLLSRAKENRRSQTNPKSKTHQWFDRESLIQNGNSGFSVSRHRSRRMASLARSQGRIFSHSHTRGTQEISKVLHRKQMLPIQSPTLRIDHISKGVHQSACPCHGLPQITGNSDLSVLGRLTVDCGIQTDSPGPSAKGHSSHVSGGVHNESQEVVSGSFTGYDLPWSPHKIGSQSHMSPIGKSSETPISSSLVPPGPPLPSQEMAGSIGGDCLRLTHGSHGSTTNETYSDARFHSLEQKDSRPPGPNSCDSNCALPPTVVDKYRPSALCFAPIPPRTSDCAHDRCLLTRLGRSAGGREKGGGESIDCSGPMVPGGTGMAHQHARVDGSIPSPQALQGQSQEQDCSSEVGQYNDLCLHQQDGRDEIVDSVPSNNKTVVMVSGQQDKNTGDTCARCGQYTGRFLITPESGPEGVEPSQEGSVYPVQDLGKTPDRYVRYDSQSQAGQFLLPLSLPQGMDQGRFYTELGKFLSDLPVSTHSHSITGAKQDQEGQDKSDSHCPEVAGEAVVLSDTQHANGDTNSATGHARPTDTIQDPPPESQNSELGGLESKRERLREQGFPEDTITTILAARARSTKQCYESRWKVFVSWCRGGDQDPFKTDVVTIVKFLQDLFEKGRSWSTIRGYVAAISACHPEFQDNSLGTIKSVKDFMDGVFKLRPPIKTVVPRWELGIVLQTFAETPFEPPEKASLQAWTWKTTFLLAITSATRVSELQALDSRPELTVLHRRKAVLRLNPFFLPKTPSQEYLNRKVELEAFCYHPKNDLERALRVLCPVRALRIYLEKTQSIRKDHQLLVSYQSGKQGFEVTKSTIAGWIKQTILFCYRQQGRSIPVSSVRAHSTRAIASSLADIHGVSPSDLCAAATWSSSCVFAKHYRLDMASSRSISNRILTAAVARKS